MSSRAFSKVGSLFSRAAFHTRKLLARTVSGRSLPSGLDDIDLARGYLDDLICEPQELSIKGWMFHPDRAFTTLRVYVNDELVESGPIKFRPDLAAAFPRIPQASQSGIDVRLSPRPGAAGRIDLVGCVGNRPIVRMRTFYRTDLDSIMPTPPADLMYRVAHVRDSRGFKQWGLKSYADFQSFISPHCDRQRIRRLLDWGCGCGRLTAHFLADNSGPEAFGCDVDGEAVAWCNKNLRAGRFKTIAPFPPTPYPDASFELVVSYSVFTHLTRDVQLAWLAEMRRVLTPGGIFIATVHGESAAALVLPNQAASLRQSGIDDGILDTTLDGVVPSGYYRGTFQTQEYTLREWGKYFDILEYKVRGIGNHQDAVVMRRPA